MKAFVFRNGLVQLGNEVPANALEVGDGPDEMLTVIVGVVSRHAYNNEDLICPGVPEARSEAAAYNAVIEFKDQIKKRLVHFLADPEAFAEFIA